MEKSKERHKKHPGERRDSKTSKKTILGVRESHLPPFITVYTRLPHVHEQERRAGRQGPTRCCREGRCDAAASVWGSGGMSLLYEHAVYWILKQMCCAVAVPAAHRGLEVSHPLGASVQF